MGSSSSLVPDLVGCAIVPGVGTGTVIGVSAVDILIWEPFFYPNTPILHAARVRLLCGMALYIYCLYACMCVRACGLNPCGGVLS